MTYVMSDIHGEYEKYKKMLKEIRFTDSDVLYVLGDVVDRGPEPIEVLKDMSMRPNVFPVIGNHEVMALSILKPLLVEITEDNAENQLDAEFFDRLRDYSENGGAVTVEKFKELSPEDREFYAEYIEEFTPYETVELGERRFILVHSGLGNYKPGKKLREYSLDELCSVRPEYGRVKFKNKNIAIVCGHTPTVEITGKAEIYREGCYINVDCGACFPDGRLACLRLDDMKEFYV